jgi:23S rRNA (uracil1939-C5)-methyltransferase
MNTIRSGDILENVAIEEALSEGKSLARHEGFVLFVEGAVPGDTADVEVRYKKKRFAEAKVTRIVTPSPERTDPFCSHFGTCGGCKWQHFSYPGQLAFKQKQVVDALTRIGKLEVIETLPILPSVRTHYYRNRLDFTFSNKRWLTREEIATTDTIIEPALGFHVPQRFDKVLDIHTCYLQDDFSNKIRNAIREFAIANDYSFFDLREQTGLLRNLTIRSTSTGEWMVLLAFHHEDMEKITAILEFISVRFPELTSLLYVINSKRNDTIFDQDIIRFKGRDHIFEEMEGLRFKISAKSFYQTNSDQAYTLYQVARSFAGLTGEESVYDLYTGTGTIANFVSRQCRHVTGIDYVADAIEDAKENSRINGILNTTFFAGDIKETLTNDFIQANGKPDVLITDPPRAGMHEDVTLKIAEMAPEKIVYVSCNPSTQARDLALLTSQYTVEKIQAVDMFPHTSHVENVALLRRRND